MTGVFPVRLCAVNFVHGQYDGRLLLLELRSVECAGNGNYKRPRIFRGISHTSNVVTLQTLELLEGWKSWRYEISEVSL